MRTLFAPALLLALAVCGRPMPRPALDRTLLDGAASASIDFTRAKPAFLPAHHGALAAGLLPRDSCPDELRDEISAFDARSMREQRRDPASYREGGYPVGWVPGRGWYAGPHQGDLRLAYVTVGDTTYAIGAATAPRERYDGPHPDQRPLARYALVWASTAAPGARHAIADQIPLSRDRPFPEIDVARRGDEVLVVCTVEEGLREHAFAARSGELVEVRRRAVGPPRAFAPLLLECGPDVLLLASDHRIGSHAPYGSVGLFAMRLAEGTSEWSEPHLVTQDLGGGRAACVRGEQVTLAWQDDRFRELDGWAWKHGRKLCVATSLDRGASWSPAVLLQDPEDERTDDEGVLVFDDGVRLLAVIGPARWSPDGDPRQAFALSRDLARWAPEAPRVLDALAELRRQEIARRPR